MPITQYKATTLNLDQYDVYVEDTAINSDYFNVTRLSDYFTGGRNSFLIGGSQNLLDGTDVLVEIKDSNGKPIYQYSVQNYFEGGSIMVSAEIYNNTPSGFATVTIVGVLETTKNGEPVPSEWEGKFNVRWSKQVLIDYELKNISPIKFSNNPQVLVEEKRFYNVDSASYSIVQEPFTASLSPLLFLAQQSGYSMAFTGSTLLESKYLGGKITGSLVIDGVTSSIDLPITKILNNTKAFTDQTIPFSVNNGTVKKMYLTSGSYSTTIDSRDVNLTSSAVLQYSTINTSSTNIPISYASLRITNLDTVSGEIAKIRVYSKVATDTAYFKIVGDVPVETQDIFVSSSIRGNVPIGNIYLAKNYRDNWYSGKIEQNTGIRSSVFTKSGSTLYYDSTDAIPTYIPLFTANFNGGTTQSNSRTFIRTGSATPGLEAWDAQVYSTEGYSSSIYVSAKPTWVTSSATQSLMFGLSSFPALDASTGSIDYAWYLSASGDLEIYRTGSYITSSGTYTSESLLSIVYENDLIKYLKDNIQQYSQSRNVNSLSGGLYFDSSFFYTSSQGITDVKFGPIVNNLTVYSSDDILLASIYANVPIDTASGVYSPTEVPYGYFIGTIPEYRLFSSTEYTLELDAYYNKTSGSVTLIGGETPKVDIYLINKLGSPKIIGNDPLGQKIGEITAYGSSQWFQQSRFNFNPKVKDSSLFGLRFVISNGFWNFSNISIKPASDPQFSPDESSILIPNTEYYNELLQYRVEFFDLNNNSSNVFAVSTPAYFTGSAADLGTIPLL